MLGIDAPERDQPFSKESAEFSQNILTGSNNKLTGQTGGQKRWNIICEWQRYKFIIIKYGYSWHYKRYSADEDYAEAEESARKIN
jgi:endonuclease YncB( thermonuclease family)